MSTATELLRRAADALRSELGPVPPYYIYGLIQEMEEHFLAAEPEAETDIWQSLTDDEVWEISKQNADDYEYFRAIEAKLKEKNHPPRPEPEADEPTDILQIAYQLGFQEGKKTKPEPARKPLSDAEIADIYYSETDIPEGHLFAFAEGFRQAEKHHGIGGGDA